MEGIVDNTNLLKDFLLEFFDFDSLKKAGLFKGLERTDYEAQADRICRFLGYKTIYEYGAKEFRGHITYAPGKRPTGEPFVTVIKSIYE